MSDAEILAWFSALASTRDRRFALVRDMMRHANGDKMTDADRVICRRVLHGDLYRQCADLPDRVVERLRYSEPRELRGRNGGIP